MSGKVFFAKEHLKIGYRKKEKISGNRKKKKRRKIIKKDPRQITGQMEKHPPGKNFLLPPGRNFHLLVRRILKDETLGLPDEQETALFETTSTGLRNWKKWQKPFIHCRSSPHFSYR